MPRKLKTFICKVCGNEFQSRQPEAKYCSKTCIMKGRGLNNWTKVELECITCGKKYKTKKSSNGKLQNNFCSKSCQSKYIYKHFGSGLTEEVKKKISKTLTGRSLKDRGYSEKAINAFVQAGQKASILKCKGHTLEEIVGVEKATEMKTKQSQQRTGVLNAQSLKNIAKRFHCSIEDAYKFTTCYGRTGDKHPMFGIILNKQERKKRIPKTINKSRARAVVTGKFNNIGWDGSWELEFLINCYEEKLGVKRFNLDPVEYLFENSIHHTWPDFIIGKYIIEVKGYMNGKSKARIKACKEFYGDKFIVIDSVKRRRKTSSLEWINKQIKIYGDLIEIINIPKNIKSGVLIEN